VNIGEHDEIICAFAQPAGGPGWSNQPLWVIVRSRLDGSLRQECLQPEEFDMYIWTLYDISAAVSAQMKQVLSAYLAGRKKKVRKSHKST
jgi:hypothetical protein